MLKRWLAFLLLTVFFLHALPVLETATDACAWMVGDNSDGGCEEDGGGEEASILKKNAAAQWCGCFDAAAAFGSHFDEEVAVALHDAQMHLPIVNREVVSPPPDMMA